MTAKSIFLLSVDPLVVAAVRDHGDNDSSFRLVERINSNATCGATGNMYPQNPSHGEWITEQLLIPAHVPEMVLAHFPKTI